MSALHKIRAFAESKVKRDALGGFASKNSDDITKVAKIATGIAAGHLPGGDPKHYIVSMTKDDDNCMIGELNQ
jgi:hypothetical protein